MQRALRDDGNGNRKMNSSNCTAPAGKGIQRALIDKHNANRERNSNSAYRWQCQREGEVKQLYSANRKMNSKSA
jgi:hypothetical protein